MKVLHILNGLNVGGAESFLKSLRACMQGDDVQMDFLLRTTSNDLGTLNYFKQSGSQIFITPSYPRHYLANHRETKKFFIENAKNYDVIHIHANSLFYFFPIAIAEKYAKSTAKIIVHSHSTSTAFFLVKYIVHGINKKRLAKKKNYIRLACGKDAGKWMFGKDAFTVVRNAIDTKKFQNSLEIRNQFRERNGITGKVLVSVGRLEVQKNQAFLLPVMKELVDEDPSIQLWICGEGSLRESLQNKIGELGLGNNVFLLGNRMDVENILKGSDVLLMPSIYEGLCIAAVEAQATGIPCLCSMAFPRETKLTDNIVFLPFETEDWVKEIKKQLQLGKIEYDNFEDIEQAGYGLKFLEQTMLKIYGKN